MLTGSLSLSLSLPYVRFAALLHRPGKTSAELEAQSLLHAQGEGVVPKTEPNATVMDWISHMSNVPAHRMPSTVPGDALPEDDEPYPDLLKKALIKLQIHKYVAHLFLPSAC